MRLVFAPHPDLMPEQPARKTEMEVSSEEKLEQILERAQVWLSLWVSPEIANRGWQLRMTNGTKIDTKFTPGELRLIDGDVVHVHLKEEIPSNPLDQVAEDLSGNMPDILAGESLAPVTHVPSMPTEEDIINYEQAKQAAMRRARAIEQERGIAVSHRRILHDEAVDDYDEDEEEGGLGGVELLADGYYGGEGYLKGERGDSALFLDADGGAESHNWEGREDDNVADDITNAPWMQRLQQQSRTDSGGIPPEAGRGGVSSTADRSSSSTTTGHPGSTTGYGRGGRGRPNPISPFGA